MSDNEQIVEENRKFITPKSIVWFLIASVVMIAYYQVVDYGLMKVQGLNYLYLWNTGAE